MSIAIIALVTVKVMLRTTVMFFKAAVVMSIASFGELKEFKACRSAAHSECALGMLSCADEMEKRSPHRLSLMCTCFVTVPMLCTSFEASEKH